MENRDEKKSWTFEKKLSIGNVFVIIGMVAGMAAQWYGLKQEVKDQQNEYRHLEYRIGQIERSNAAFLDLKDTTTKLAVQVDELLKITDRLDRRLERAERNNHIPRVLPP